MVVNRDDCVKEMIERHLSNRGTFEIITKEKTTEHLLEESNEFVRHIHQTVNSMNSNHMKYIPRYLEQDKRIPVMHFLVKLYKGKICLPPYRLVVSIVGFPLYGVGRWVDTHLKEFLHFCKTCIKNSDDVLRILKDFKIVHDNVFITT